MNKYKYAIEIGGALTKIFVQGEGYALCEPTLVASEPSASGYRIVGLGQNAKDMLGKTNESIEVFSPISNGKIINYEYLKTLLSYFFDKLDFKKGHESIVALVSLALSDAEKEEYLSVLYELGFKEVLLIPSVVCACVGIGKNISSTKTNMIVSIGGANTDIAVINLNSVVKGATLGLGGKAVDVAIANTIAYNHGIVVGLGTSEKLKKEVGSLYPNDTLNMEVTGVDVDSKVPCSYIISSNDLLPVLEPFYDEIIRLIDVTLTSLQPEISQDIINNGVLFAGGMSNISGLEYFLKQRLKFPFKIVDNAENVAILGAGKLLDDVNLLKKIHENT